MYEMEYKKNATLYLLSNFIWLVAYFLLFHFLENFSGKQRVPCVPVYLIKLIYI